MVYAWCENEIVKWGAEEPSSFFFFSDSSFSFPHRFPFPGAVASLEGQAIRHRATQKVAVCGHTQTFQASPGGATGPWPQPVKRLDGVESSFEESLASWQWHWHWHWHWQGDTAAHRRLFHEGRLRREGQGRKLELELSWRDGPEPAARLTGGSRWKATPRVLVMVLQCFPAGLDAVLETLRKPMLKHKRGSTGELLPQRQDVRIPAPSGDAAQGHHATEGRK
ncbi:hypothetical protein BBK36DRAFT_165377 [Trichoderma citrinoviride]|uniref:Uncharacterized protein n=1 Tax=Trichoderma citrinoviride TaxID=58853 RepID=A0A2T4B784_9HYPO|nr:hypothetical protein BBK36DRAFT_165377 [Trichoderma citrinoviride]PTB65148.1 hypothetical protein BBK36DRAFT_165377 [Trichoderma citrinoviride]